MIDERFIDLARQYHTDDFRRFRVGIAKSVYEFAFYAEFFQHFGNFGPAAVDEHHFDAHELQKHEIAHDGSL